jgi:hypothetical protein
LAEENGPDDTSGPPEREEEQAEDTRRVRPLFRFGRRGSKEEPEDEGGGSEEDSEEETSRAPPVRPVRVVKFVPPGEDDQGEDRVEGTEDMDGGEPQFTVVEEATFTDEEEAPFQVEEETPFIVDEEAPFTEEEGEAPFVLEEEGEAPFVLEEEGEAPLDTVETTPAAYEDMEETRWEEPVHDTLSTQEEAETGEEFELRSEESPETFEHVEQQPPATPAAPGEESKPHYHKYLKPDEELISRHPAKGPATGFDRDMDADAGEIDFGIDLIDPSERRKKRKKPPMKDPGAGPKKGVGGHDFDAEVDTRGTGAEVGVDYEKRRKRRL